MAALSLDGEKREKREKAGLGQKRHQRLPSEGSLAAVVAAWSVPTLAEPPPRIPTQ